MPEFSPISNFQKISEDFMQNIIRKFFPIGKFQIVSKEIRQNVIGKFSPVCKFHKNSYKAL